MFATKDGLLEYYHVDSDKYKSDIVNPPCLDIN
jgi:hypothetical protein